MKNQDVIITGIEELLLRELNIKAEVKVMSEDRIVIKFKEMNITITYNTVYDFYTVFNTNDREHSRYCSLIELGENIKDVWDKIIDNIGGLCFNY